MKQTREKWLWAGLALSCTLLIAPLANTADAPPPTIPGYVPSTNPHDFSGLWRSRPTPGVTLFALAPTLPFTKSAQLRADHATAMAAKNTPLATPHVMCRPTGINQAVGPIAPIYILQSDKKLAFIVTDEIRNIQQVYFQDQHPKDLVPSYGGHSIAHWEGNTLVVDTIGYNGRGIVQGAMHSKDLHMTRRMSKSADGRILSIELTIEDPATFTETLSLKREWGWVGGSQPLEFDCEENPREDNFSDIVFEDEYLQPVCIQYEGEGDQLSKVVCNAKQ